MIRPTFALLLALYGTSACAQHPDLDDFPEAASGFFEQELKIVDVAVKTKDLQLLNGVHQRQLAFLGSWGYAPGNLDDYLFHESVLAKYPECTSIVDNIVVLGVDEIRLPKSEGTSRIGLLKEYKSCRRLAEAQKALTPGTLPIPAGQIEQTRQALLQVSPKLNDAKILVRADRSLMIRLEVPFTLAFNLLKPMCAPSQQVLKAQLPDNPIQKMMIVSGGTEKLTCWF